MTSDGISHVPRIDGAGRDLPRLTSLRAFAAFSVFLYHVGHDTNWSLAEGLFEHGYVGVGFFFILSGFVLTWSTRPGLPARSFYARRFARVYPSHAVMLLVALAVPVTSFAFSWPALLTNVTLTQAWFPQWPIVFGLNAVSWSLSCEFFFYLCTPPLLRWAHRTPTRRVTAVLVAWYVATTVVSVLLGLAGPYDVWAYTLPVLRSGEFALGVLLGILAMRGALPRVPLWSALLLIAVAWGGTAGRENPQTLADALFDLPFAALVCAGAAADLRGAPGLLRHRALIYAGQVSFAFYLVHELALFNLTPVVDALPHTRPARLLFLIGMTAVCGLLAAALHEGVEKPAQRRLRARLEPRRPVASTAHALRG